MNFPKLFSGLLMATALTIPALSKADLTDGAPESHHKACIKDLKVTCQQWANQETSMSTENVINELIRNIEIRDAKAVTDMFAEDAFFDEMVGTGGVAHGRENIGKLWANFFNDVSKDTKDNHWDIHQKIINGKNAAIERTSHFVYKGRKVSIDMVAIIELDENNKIKVYKDYCDSRVFIPQDETAEWQAYLKAQKK